MTRVGINGVEIFHEVHGEGQPILLIHHLAGSTGSWVDQFPELSQSFRTIAFDLRGHGKSHASKSGYTVDNLAEDARQLLEYLGVRDVHVVGHSIGGSIALMLVLEHPELARSLTLVGASPEPITESRREYYQSLVDIALSEGMVAVADERKRTANFPKIITEREEIWSSFRMRYADTSITGFVNCVKGLFTMRDLTSSLASIRVPTLGISGELDTSAMPYLKIFSKEITNFRTEVIIGSGHFCPLEKPKEFNNILLRFLEAVDENTS